MKEGSVRDALTSENFGITSGTSSRDTILKESSYLPQPADCPKPPIKILIDDINEVVIEEQMVIECLAGITPNRYGYKISPFPPSHHLD